ncbi:MAG: SLC13 family permease [Gammaproteobacteria bacterium]|nr:SLC13 family permease [Gammaproteobacteria bacterium]
MMMRYVVGVLLVGLFPVMPHAADEYGLIVEYQGDLVFNEAMLISAIVLTVTFIGIFTEMLHGIERVKVAAGGAVAMIIVGQFYGFYSPDLAVVSVDWNVVFLLGAMMTVIAMMIPTGGFDMLAYRIANFSKGRLYLLLALIGTCVTVLSLLLDNVTTVVIFGPLIILIARAQKITPIPYLLAAALLSDTGGVATLVGDPPNLMIGSAANISFNDFAYHMVPPVFIAWIGVLILLKYLFKEELAETPADVSDYSTEVKNPRVWNASLIILGVMVVLFMLHHKFHWEPWFVAAIGMVSLMYVSRKIIMDNTFEHVEITLLVFFISLFMLVGGVEHSRFLMYIGQYITPFVQQDLLMATIILMWVGAVMSAAIDNIPFTAAMIPIIMSMETVGINVTPLWWGLAIGVGMGGNGTHIGSTANVFIVTISERLARNENDPSLRITPGLWFRKGLPVMLLTLVLSTIFFIVFWDFLSRPLA